MSFLTSSGNVLTKDDGIMFVLSSIDIFNSLILLDIFSFSILIHLNFL